MNYELRASMISVIIPMYNAENTIIQTLTGLEDQTRRDFEVIVVDDGSADNSSKLVAEFESTSNLSIKLVHQENAGPAKARNLGVDESNGNYVEYNDWLIWQMLEGYN